jgi:P27 family predicted phage terminase small subunit
LARPRLPLSVVSDARTLARRGAKPAGARLDELPDPPGHLSELAAAEWWRVGAVAVEVGTLTRADLRGLELLAETLATEREARELLAREGTTIEAGSGGRKAHPAVGMMAQARAQAHRLLHDFALLPRARSYVSPVAESRPHDPAERFFTA